MSLRRSLLALAIAMPLSVFAAVPGAQKLYPNLVDNIDRPLRYQPDNGDFVIVNGPEFFNRPLYGGNTGFRSDAGDKPEFTLYLPGRGGNLRLGIRTSSGAKWLNDAERIEARYRPGSMIYEIADPLLGAGTLTLTVLAMNATEGIVVRVESKGTPAGLELTWAFGGANGVRGTRDGDIGTERVPISEYFQLKPEYCVANEFKIEGSTFVMQSKPGRILGLAPAGATLAVADAAQWSSLGKLLDTAGTSSATPVVVGRIALTAAQPEYLALQRLPDPSATAEELSTYQAVTAQGANAPRQTTRVPLLPAYQVQDVARVFAETEAHFAALRRHVTVETPDAFINAAVGALNVAIDAVWDEPQGAVMHGAIAWRSKLLGWRGPYGQDAFGWHDRAKRHLSYWATRQNTSDIPDTIPPADENANLARNETGLHSNGDMSNSHYDMNLVYIDALFRHLQWTGDIEMARELWPVIERHLAWERRLFRREFGPEKLPLYEAYAAIWASDDLQYHGGGVTHTSAYNYYHNKSAARLARLLGKDAQPYENEAALILKGMRQQLWLLDRGWYAEFKDLLGQQLVHPAAALWTFYHAADSETMNPFEAWQMTRYIDTEIPHLPVRGPGVPTDESYASLSTTTWMPYAWSINNVVMGEIVHTALGFWQAGRPDDAQRLVKSVLLAAMYMGISPGNVGSMSYLDVYRRESQRDFADGGGVLSRALIEGLFGVRPDALEGVLKVRPGFPAKWDHASLDHPDVRVAFRRSGRRDTFRVEPRFGKPMALLLELRATPAGVARALVNGRPVDWKVDSDPVGAPRIIISAPAQAVFDVVVEWNQPFEAITVPKLVSSPGKSLTLPFEGRHILGWLDPQQVLSGPHFRNLKPTGSTLHASITGLAGHRTFFVRVQTGEMVWWQPVHVEIRDDGKQVSLAPAARQISGSLEPVDLEAYFNDTVTRIFKNEYRSPRSPFVSLAIPKQGIGGWAGSVKATAEIDDTGLRAAAAANGGRISTPAGVPFATPGGSEARNIVFTSQWDNYPREATVPLNGSARAVHLLMAGSTNWMQSRFDNGEVVVTYSDGTKATLTLNNPVNWWPIEQDFFVDDFQFRRPEPLPVRVDLKTGKVRVLEMSTFKGTGRTIPGGSATILELPLDPAKTLQSLTVRTLANEVVIGLMAVTLER